MYEHMIERLGAAHREDPWPAPPEVLVPIVHVLMEGLMRRRFLTPELISDDVFGGGIVESAIRLCDVLRVTYRRWGTTVRGPEVRFIGLDRLEDFFYYVAFSRSATLRVNKQLLMKRRQNGRRSAGYRACAQASTAIVRWRSTSATDIERRVAISGRERP